MFLSSMLPLGQASAHMQPNGNQHAASLAKGKHSNTTKSKKGPPACTPNKVAGPINTMAATCSRFPANEQIQMIFNNTSQIIGTANTGSGNFQGFPILIIN
jgi:hypothetical protein